MIELPITQGKVALIDESDYELVSQYRWAAHYKQAQDKWYVKGYVKGNIIGLHTLLLNPGPGLEVDHINSDGLDNRRCNIRVVTRAQNLQNRRANRNGSSQYVGVYFEAYTGRWCAAVKKDGRITRSRHDTELEAAIARDKMALAIFGNHARLNVPEVADGTL